MSKNSKKGLKQSLKECSSSMQNLSENLAEAIRSNSLFVPNAEQADMDLRLKVIVKIWSLSVCASFSLFLDSSTKTSKSYP